MQTRAHMHTHTHTTTHAHAHTRTHARTHTHTQTHTHTHTHTQTRTHTHTHIHTHTHTHTHTCISAHKAHTSCQFTAQKASPTFQHCLRCFPPLVLIRSKQVKAPPGWLQLLLLKSRRHLFSKEGKFFFE